MQFDNPTTARIVRHDRSPFPHVLGSDGAAIVGLGSVALARSVDRPEGTFLTPRE
jgi:hypothetical protein